MTGTVPWYEMPRLMRLAVIWREWKWAVRYARASGKSSIWRILGRWQRESRSERWNDYFCCSSRGMYGEPTCGCQGVLTGEYYADLADYLDFHRDITRVMP